MSAYDLVKIGHAALGTLALVCYWTAAFAPKGRTVHVTAGRIYLGLIAGLIVSAIPLVVRRFESDGVASGVFFVHLLVLVSLASSVAWRAVRLKRDWRRYANVSYLAMAWLVLATGVASAALGALHSNLIFVAFGLLGLRLWRSMTVFASRGPAASNWWKVQHYRGMIGNGIATHIAFLLIGLPRLLPGLNSGLLQYVGWLAPLSIGLTVQFVLDRRHRPPAAALRSQVA